MMHLDARIGPPRWAAAIGLLAVSLLIPAGASADSAVNGTLVGVATCGAGLNAPAAPVVVAVEGTDLTTHTAGSGEFRLPVPGGLTLTIDAINPSDTSVASRENVVVDAGATLDIGSLDLPVCPQLTLDTAMPSQTDQPQEDNRNTPDQG